MSKPTILCVDDEKVILVGLKEQLQRAFQGEYSIEVADCGEVALEIIEDLMKLNIDVPLVIADQNMPGMKGEDLLANVHTLLPNTLKIMLTGQASAEAVGTAVNRASLYRYISKPWELDDLFLTTKSAIRSYFQDKSLEENNNLLRKAQEELIQINAELEQRVDLRTSELATALNNLKAAQTQLIDAARSAGMADTAVSVLHNVGNVLNSINTSVAIVDERIRYSKLGGLEKLSELLQQERVNWGDFLSNHKRGKHIPDFVSLLADNWGEDKQFYLDEIKGLAKNILHIKNVINTQQSISVAVGMTEETNIEAMLDDAIALSIIEEQKDATEIVRDFSQLKKKVIIDRVKVTQIVVNLIKNSIDSVMESDVQNKQLTICLRDHDDDHLIIQIIDNGIGIALDNLTKIFSFGFTTKIGRRGYGLHSSANSAHEMQGSLKAESEGIGKGATFNLILPHIPNETQEPGFMGRLKG